MSKNNITINSVQMMRGFAAFLVALFHFSEMFAAKGGMSPVAFVLNGGYAGVDIFFVISGYIMALTSQKLRSGFSPAFFFFLKRILRIFGGWIPVFLFLCVLFPLLYPYKIANANLLKSLFLIPQPHSENILAVSWTLSYEIYFYTMISCLLLLFNKRVIYIVLLYALVIFILRFPVDILAQKPFYFEYISYNHFYPNIILSAYSLEFLAGFVACMLPSRLNVSLAIWLTVVGILLFATSMAYIKYVLNGGYVEGSLIRALFFGFSSLLIITGLVKLETAKKISIPPFFVFLGNISYTIYLLHIPVFIIFFTALVKIREWTGFPFTTYSELTTVVAMLILLILSSLHYTFIENPIHNRIRSLIDKSKAKGREFNNPRI